MSCAVCISPNNFLSLSLIQDLLAPGPDQVDAGPRVEGQRGTGWGGRRRGHRSHLTAVRHEDRRRQRQRGQGAVTSGSCYVESMSVITKYLGYNGYNLG